MPVLLRQSDTVQVEKVFDAASLQLSVSSQKRTIVAKTDL